MVNYLHFLNLDEWEIMTFGDIGDTQDIEG